MNHRPQTLAEVIGQEHITKGLPSVVEKRQAFLFHGPSGVGKTTIARIVARLTDCETIEIDGASRTGINDMREIAETVNYQSIHGKGKAVILDECHQLSKQAWQSLLKIVEEPPPGVYWLFCTTEPTKVPKTIKTRCQTYALRSLNDSEIRKVLDGKASDLSDDILDLVVESAQGSPRQALTNLAQVSECENLEEAQAVLSQVSAGPQAIELARLLIEKQFSDREARRILKSMKDDKTPTEGVRLVVLNYMASVCLNKDNDWAVRVMSQFSAPCIEQNGIADLLLRVERLLWERNR